jgi:hypothetical protein
MGVDTLQIVNTEYIYISDRLIGDLHDRIMAYKSGRQIEELRLTLPFLSANSKPRNLGINRYKMVADVTEFIRELTGSLAYPSKFVRFIAGVKWFDLYIAEQKYRVAWLIGNQNGDEGKALISLCGSIDNYIGYEAEKVKKHGWKPSSVQGLRNIVASCTKGRRFEDSYPEDHAEIEAIVLESAHLSMSLEDHEDSEFIGSAEVEVLARLYFGMTADQADRIHLNRIIAGESDAFDAVYLGAPLWVRTVPTSELFEPTGDGPVVLEIY